MHGQTEATMASLCKAVVYTAGNPGCLSHSQPSYDYGRSLYIGCEGMSSFHNAQQAQNTRTVKPQKYYHTDEV